MSGMQRGAQRLEALDVLRGIAALAVVVYHYSERYAQVHGVSPMGWRFAFGAHGVNLFFMISGYVIALTLDRSRDAADFLVSRASRLYPAYWACIALTLAGVGFLGTAGLAEWKIDAEDVWWNLPMLQEFVKRPSVDGVYWTLAVELRFYALAWLLWTVGALARPLAVVTGWLSLSALQGWLPGAVRVNAFLEWFPLFAVGMTVFAASRSGWTAAHCGLLALALAIDGAIRGAGAAVLDTGLCVLFLVACRSTWRRIPKVMLWLGAISYPLYLLHQNLGFAVIHALGATGVAAFCALLAVLALATLVHVAVEQPAMHWIRARWRRRRATST